jgi:protein SCO1/2
MLQAVRAFAIALILAIASLWAVAWFSQDESETLGDSFSRMAAALLGNEAAVPSAGGVQLPQGLTLGGPISLTDHAGRAVTESSFGDQFLLIYFGFTYCPDVCPTELGTIAAVIDALEQQGARVTPVFISIDPERDTPAAMADYVSRFHPRMVGLTGTPEQVAAAARAFRVFYAKVHRPETTTYLMDHSSFIYLTGPDLRVRALFRPETAPEAIAQAVRGQLR